MRGRNDNPFMKRLQSSHSTRGWGARRGPLAICLIGFMAAVSMVFMYRIRQNIAELTSDSMPGARFANALIEDAAVSEVARLRRLAGRPQENQAVLDRAIESMKRTMEDYSGAVFSDVDRENWEVSRAALHRYVDRVASGADSAVLDEAYEGMVASYRALRDYNRERSARLVSGSGEHIHAAMRWNVIFLCTLLVSFAALTAYISLSSVKDASPDDF